MLEIIGNIGNKTKDATFPNTTFFQTPCISFCMDRNSFIESIIWGPFRSSVLIKVSLSGTGHYTFWDGINVWFVYVFVCMCIRGVRIYQHCIAKLVILRTIMCLSVCVCNSMFVCMCECVCSVCYICNGKWPSLFFYFGKHIARQLKHNLSKSNLFGFNNKKHYSHILLHTYLSRLH